jgi:hypothetical protein
MNSASPPDLRQIFWSGFAPKCLNVKRSHRIAILNVGAITTADGFANLRVVEDPIDDLAPDTNAAHVLIEELVALKDQAVRDALAFRVQQSDLERY